MTFRPHHFVRPPFNAYNRSQQALRIRRRLRDATDLGHGPHRDGLLVRHMGTPVTRAAPLTSCFLARVSHRPTHRFLRFAAVARRRGSPQVKRSGTVWSARGRVVRRLAVV